MEPAAVRLYLCGSSVAMMERLALDRSAPLYGRRTGQWRVEPLAAWDLRPAFRRPLPDLIRIYAVTGGIPHYVKLLDPRRSLATSIREHVLEKDQRSTRRFRSCCARSCASLVFTSRSLPRWPSDPTSWARSLENGARSSEHHALPGRARRACVASTRGPHHRAESEEVTSRPLPYRRSVHALLVPLRIPKSRSPRARRSGGSARTKCHAGARSVRIDDSRGRRAGPSLRNRRSPAGSVRARFRGRHWGTDSELDVVLLDADRRRAFVVEVKSSRRPVGRELLVDLRARVARVPELARLDLTFALACPAGFRNGRRSPARDERLIDLRRP